MATVAAQASSNAAAPADRGIPAAVANALVVLGDWTQFSLRAVGGLFSKEFKLQEAIAAAVVVGYQSVAVVALTGLFIGMVLAVQAYSIFHKIGMETSLGGVVHVSVLRELGPVLTAVMLAGRVGSAMAAQIGTMRVTEQLEAMACLGVDPVRFLVAPRFVACLVMIPLLTVLANVMGILGSSMLCLHVYGIESHHYWQHTREFAGLWDLFVGLFNVTIFGAVLVLIACHRGFRCGAGAEGVGRAATEAFVASFLAILAIDFLLGLLSNGLYEIIWPVGTRAVP